jgi:peptide/nickel transport system permease protein
MGERWLLRFILRRLAIAIPLLALTSLAVFSLLHLVPGDPARVLLGTRSVSPEALASIRAKYHLNDPFFVQYFRWLLDVVQGDLGRSIRASQSVSQTIGDRLGLTLYLGFYSAVVSLGLGVPLGVIAAFRRGTWIDRAVVTFGVFGVSAPAFATGLFLLYFLGVVMDWFPIFGPGTGFIDRGWHLTLPALALGLSVMGLVTKITRATMIEELQKDYVAFARARGLSLGRITLGYVLRNALVPVVTAAGLVVVGLLTGEVMVEVTFALPGLGSLLVDSVVQRDLPLIQGTVLLLSAFVVVMHLAIDVLYRVIDPRIRFGRVEG